MPGVRCRGASRGASARVCLRPRLSWHNCSSGPNATAVCSPLLSRGVDLKRERMIQFGLAVAISLLVAAVAAGEVPPIRRGEWIVTVDSGQNLRGRWVGQALPEDPNALHGSWLLLSDTGKTVLSGTWSARKAQRGFRGSWCPPRINLAEPSRAPGKLLWGVVAGQPCSNYWSRLWQAKSRVRGEAAGGRDSGGSRGPRLRLESASRVFRSLRGLIRLPPRSSPSFNIPCRSVVNASCRGLARRNGVPAGRGPAAAGI